MALWPHLWRVVALLVLAAFVLLVPQHAAEVNWLGGFGSSYYNMRWPHERSDRYSHLRNPITPAEPGVIRYGGGGSGLEGVYKTLTTNQSIRHLLLSYRSYGCIVDSQPFAFEFGDGDRFPPLETLYLSEYEFMNTREYEYEKQRWETSVLYKLLKTLAGLGLNFTPDSRLTVPEPNIDKWLRVMDFSNIQDLELSWPEDIFFHRLTNKLPKVKRFLLRANLNQYRDDYIMFIKSLEGLQTLELVGTNTKICKCHGNRTFFPITDILEDRGLHLRSLSLHQFEGTDPENRRTMLSVSEIEYIYKACPNLTHLGLDIDRNGSWPLEHLKAIVQGQSVTYLTLGLEIGADLHPPGNYYPHVESYSYRQEKYREPYIDSNSAHQLFTLMRDAKVGEELERVDIVVGDQRRDWRGGLRTIQWHEGRAYKMVCSVKDKEGVRWAAGLPWCMLEREFLREENEEELSEDGEVQMFRPRIPEETVELF
ncbi:hypothetical protein BGW36DRAFT_425778 [Talaromyces proteolyticus]|uniref:Uncharacterized protein n=1 Tax=Talaromyces proteolyticus TaxID=1131652 RepID=A0AAD4KU81_9EURO|nr:uncharacterized protein BGW36DRAFT_425778 [Talaromyces proteolyticus]KAH8700978.1 hypothetical protein BGW36DRAFT_425778 [Talaromyces proteolyticus]